MLLTHAQQHKSYYSYSTEQEMKKRSRKKQQIKAAARHEIALKTFLIGLLILLHYGRSPSLKVVLQGCHAHPIRRAKISSANSEALNLRHTVFQRIFLNLLHPYTSAFASPAHQTHCSLSQSSSPHILKDP